MGDREQNHDTFNQQVLRIFRGEPVPALDWEGQWKHLATATAGLEPGDCRLPSVSAYLNECDEAFAQGDAPAFARAAQKVAEAMRR